MLRRRVIGLLPIAIVLFWLTMMGLLCRREWGFERLGNPSNPATLPQERSDMWLQVLLPDGTRAGYVALHTLPEERDGQAGARTRIRAHITLVPLEEPTPLAMSGWAWESARSGLEEAVFSIYTGEVETRLEAAIEHENETPVLHIRIEVGDETIPIEIPGGNPLRLLASSPLHSRELADLEVGKRYALEAFDPITMGLAEARIECVATEPFSIGGTQTAARELLITLSGLEMKAWVAAEEGPAGVRPGDMLRCETPLGLTLERTTESEALEPETGTSGPSLLSFTAVVPTGARPVRGAQAMEFRLGGSGATQEIPEDDMQSRLGEQRYAVVCLEAPAFSPERPATCPAFAPFLEAEPLVQSDDPKIRRMAEEIVGGSTDLWESAMRLHRWVHDHIEKEVVIGVPSAIEVLASRRGDCNEHTVLFTALARSVGIPCQIALGLVWSEEMQGFYYHAWPEVYAGRWIAMDPTLDQVVADATHIKLLTGGIGRWFGLLSFVGQIEIEVLTVEKVKAARQTGAPGAEMIQTDLLTKRFGTFTAVDALDLEVGEGEFFCFLGPNGAGKTTTIKMLTGLLRPTEGRAVLGGLDIGRDPVAAKALLGYIPDTPYLYEKLTGREFLRFVAGLYRLPDSAVRTLGEELLEQFGLVEMGNRLIGQYSHGMRQKLSFASCFLHEPRIVVVDEPWVGLDPKNIRFVKEFLKAKTREGTTVFMSTHSLSIIEDVANRIGIIHHGRLLHTGSLNETLALASRPGSLEDVFLELTEGEGA